MYQKLATIVFSLLRCRHPLRLDLHFATEMAW